MKNILALLADWANGIFALLTAGHITQTEILWWYVPIALALSHLPDIDAVPELITRGRVAASAEYVHDHRTLLHFPIISIPLSMAIGCIFGFWGWVVCFAVILHLLNDLYGTGWGIPVLWPFSKRRYKILGRRANRLRSILVKDDDWKKLSDSERRLRILVSWDDEEIVDYIARWGMDDWINRWYLRINWISIIEYLLFAGACVLLLIYFW